MKLRVALWIIILHMVTCAPPSHSHSRQLSPPMLTMQGVHVEGGASLVPSHPDLLKKIGVIGDAVGGGGGGFHS